MRETINEEALKALIAGRGVSDFQITQEDGGFVLSVRYTGASRWLQLRSRDKSPRTWAKLDTLALYLQRLGVRKFSVELGASDA